MRAPVLAALAIVAAGLARPAIAGVCIGTLEECVAKAKAQAQPSTSVDVMISFDSNSAVLTPEAQAKLGAFAKQMMDQRLAAKSFIIEGHTDAFGPDAYNEDLSLRRARSVAAFLVEKGVPTTRLEAVGLGESAPRASDPYDAANRRVEMRIKLR
jgi:outer membrane protein OmpA-like peptidoglycan-associated protein